MGLRGQHSHLLHLVLLPSLAGDHGVVLVPTEHPVHHLDQVDGAVVLVPPTVKQEQPGGQSGELQVRDSYEGS